MTYESPIEISKEITQNLEDYVMTIVQKYDVIVNKEELKKALQYDRDQYAKGYADGQRAGERTAKVKLQDICWEDTRRYKEGMCASCGRSVHDHAKYCDECGCRLEWDE